MAEDNQEPAPRRLKIKIIPSKKDTVGHDQAQNDRTEQTQPQEYEEEVPQPLHTPFIQSMPAPMPTSKLPQIYTLKEYQIPWQINDEKQLKIFCQDTLQKKDVPAIVRVRLYLCLAGLSCVSRLLARAYLNRAKDGIWELLGMELDWCDRETVAGFELIAEACWVRRVGRTWTTPTTPSNIFDY